MPFIPLGARKYRDVILDEDKADLLADQRAKDRRAIDVHRGTHAATDSMYSGRFQCRAQPECFGATKMLTMPKPWAAPEADGGKGPASEHAKKYADWGACAAGGHALPRARSTPALGGGNPGKDAMMAASPMTIELLRWQALGKHTKLTDTSGHTVSQHDDGPEIPAVPEAAKPFKIPKTLPGLVNFPKYSLFEDSHMKRRERVEFNATEQLRREAAAEEEEELYGGDTPPGTPSRSLPGAFKTFNGYKAPACPHSMWKTVSTGAPVLRSNIGRGVPTFAGSAVPSGRGCASSSFFRC